MTRKHWLWLLLFVPVALFIAWFIYERVAIWVTPRPQWVTATPEVSYHYPCSGAGYGERDPDESETVPVSEKRARRIAHRVFVRQKGPFASIYWTMGSGPYLVQATLPDGQQRLSWVLGRVIEYDDAYSRGVAATLYIDATTGDPLLLITDVHVSDPGYLCFDLQLFEWLAVRSLPVYAFIGYVALVTIIAVVVLLWRWIRTKIRARRSPPRPQQ